jgi:hypothetical protein
MRSQYLNRRLAAGFVLALLLAATEVAVAQTPTDQSDSSYEVTSSIELGFRGRKVEGSLDKFRSDLNYKSGFRIFDSSLLIENKARNGPIFDSLLVMASGWGGDPTGMVRASMEKAGAYRFDSNIRRVKYFNNLIDHAVGQQGRFSQHWANTQRNFGDFDVTIFPEWDKFRLRLGYSYNRVGGPAGYNVRAYSDEFPVTSDVEAKSDDFRFGVDGKLLGFNLGLTYGHRKFDENTRYFIDGLNLGNNETNNARLFTFERKYPISGSTNYGHFRLQQTFAKRVDVSARVIYSVSDTFFALEELLTGRDGSNNFIDRNFFRIGGSAKRPQTRADLGVTWMATDKFRISNTVNFEQFNISGANLLYEEQIRRNAAGNPIAPVIDNKDALRIIAYRRLMNTIEADYQVNRRFGFNIGYRFSHRRVAVDGFDRDNDPVPPTVGLIEEEFSNSTHTLLAGLMVKPVKNWTIYGDVEHGRADNVFTRTANYEFTNFRVRSRMNFDRVGFNVSFITKDNNNPTRSDATPPVAFGAEIKTRIFATGLDWSPSEKFFMSGGYTYHHLTSEALVRVPILVGGSQVRAIGLSSYLVRDHSFNVDVSAKPLKRLSFFAAYRINDDGGQGSRIGVLPDIISSYPMRFQSPEVRVIIRLTRNIDWNIGYQYFDYDDSFLPVQNYNAHLPYTSLRIYFGKRAGDR